VVPLFPGVPGGPELLVILLVFLVLVVPLVLVAVVVLGVSVLAGGDEPAGSEGREGPVPDPDAVDPSTAEAGTGASGDDSGSS
jgi:sec-independent protein translocase protein TatA